MDAFYKRVGFSDTASLGILRKAVAEQKEMAQFVMLSAPRDNVGLKKATEDYVIGQKAFFADKKHKFDPPGVPKKILKKKDALSGSYAQIVDKVDKLGCQFSDLSIFIKNQFKLAGQA